MSKTIDQRIVEMRFDNAEFERNTKQTINSLEELKKGLNLEESTRSLTNLDRAARSFSLAGISDGVDQLSNRFSNLGIVGLTVIQNLQLPQ